LIELVRRFLAQKMKGQGSG